MADDAPKGNTTRLLLTLAAALVVIGVVIWMLAGSEAEEDTVPAYQADVTDESGGELIVTDPDAPGVEDLELPETEMTPVPVDEAAAE